MSSIISSSLTSSPRSSTARSSPAAGVSSSRISRSMSPLAMCGSPYIALIRCACVPLPDPCGPRTRMFMRGFLPEEAFVMAHDHLRLHLSHRLERHADDDQDRGAAESTVGRLVEVESHVNLVCRLLLEKKKE